ncbi:hypothetical protein BVY03_01620 [bacterium K02(2017)]|nr:hypothetical protein BVY03_01620 [bacterium K02(2017)]
MQIKKVAVLGSGVMGAAIAAHLANAGIPSLLFDIVPPSLSDEDKKGGLTTESPAFRNKFALNAINNNLPKAKPSPIFDKKVLKLISPANFNDDLPKLKDCDWVIEVVVERLDIKQKVFTSIEKHLKAGAIISSNTSGIKLADMVEGRSEEFAKNFLITHFFNPVRYMKLVEIISSPKTNPETVSFMADFLENALGKGIVYAKDTPNFIANRIGVFTFMATLHQAIEDGLSVEAVDKISGSATGKPKSATFRTCDIVGLDTLSHVAKQSFELLDNDEGRDKYKMPAIVETLIKNKWLGEKSGQGFYKKEKDENGKRLILSLDLKSGEYTPQEKVRYDSLGAARNIEDVDERIKTVINAEDQAGQFAWNIIRESLTYSANRIPEIADDIVNIDNAMKWGFNWELGPFEVLDAIGVKEFADRLEKENITIPKIIQDVLSKGDGVFYKTIENKPHYFDVKSQSYQAIKLPKTSIVLKNLRLQNKVIKANDGASIIDLDDGVLNVEFHTKMNAIDADIGQMINEAIDLAENDSNYKGIVISNDAPHFSVGANLMLIWMEAQQQNWDGIESMVKSFQDVVMRLRYSKVPTVAAPSGMALGGGCEVILGCDAVRAHCETYIGLVEFGAGLIPGGCGNKNLMLNIQDNLYEKGATGWAGKSDGGPFPKVQKTFEAIGFAKVATSAVEGIKIGYLPGQNRTKVSMSRDRLLHDAKNDVIQMADNYQAPEPREKILVAGAGGKAAMESAISNYLIQGLISEHDALIANKLALVLNGGALPTQGYVSEQELLDIEREAFMSLCAQEKTQARMQHLLLKGKPLRN